MKTFSLFCLIISLAACTSANKLTNNATGTYPVGIAFNSVCCGPPPEDFLQTFVQNFNTTNRVRVAADKIAGCGREGEYVILFSTGPLKTAVQNKFIAALEALVPAQNEINKKTNTSAGGIELLRAVQTTAYEHCRIKIQPWTY